MSTHFDDAFASRQGLLNDDDIFDFDAASARSSSNNPTNSRQVTVEDAELSDVLSNDDDGLFSDGTSDFDNNSDDEAGEEEDVGPEGDNVYSWKIDHSSGDHKLRRKFLSLLERYRC